MSEKIEIIIGGDIVPTKSNLADFESGDISGVISHDLFELLQSVDCRVFNLETPITDAETPIEKEGACFRTTTKSLLGIKRLNPDLLTLANNHIMDQGERGLNSTIEALKNYGISYVGVGANIHEANSFFIMNIKGNRIGVYACAEHEYSVATNVLPGANPFDPLETPDDISRTREKCDYLIVLYHGGKEYYEYPSPELQKRCRKMVEKGADYVICQHSHCIGTVEKYKKGRIIYGQGNFLLDKYAKVYETYFQTGMLVKINLEANISSYELIPIKKVNNGVRLADVDEKINILRVLEEKSLKVSDDIFIEYNYRKYVKTIASRYIIRLTRLGYILSSIDNRIFKGKILNRDYKKFLGKHQRLALQNCLQCEVHNEILRTYLENRGV